MPITIVKGQSKKETSYHGNGSVTSKIVVDNRKNPRCRISGTTDTEQEIAVGNIRR